MKYDTYIFYFITLLPQKILCYIMRVMSSDFD